MVWMTLSDGRIERSAAQDTIKFPLFSLFVYISTMRFYYFVAAVRTSIRGVGGGLGDGRITGHPQNNHIEGNNR